MKTSKAIEVFELARHGQSLPTKIEELVPLSFVGQTAVNFFRDKLKLMNHLKMTEEQRKATLKDGQQAGELLLDIEARIGELAEKEPQVQSARVHRKPPKKGKFTGTLPTGQPPKHERLGLSEKRMRTAKTIAKHPKIVEKVKKKAVENEDIPTKTAVLSEIRYQKEKKRRKDVKVKEKKTRIELSIEQQTCLNKLERGLASLPKPEEIPTDWTEEGLAMAMKIVEFIYKRLEVFRGKK